MNETNIASASYTPYIKEDGGVTWLAAGDNLYLWMDDQFVLYKPLPLGQNQYMSGLAIISDTISDTLYLEQGGILWSLAYRQDKTTTKRYYAGGQQLATRVGDELYYTLPDPTSTSLTLANADGTLAGYALYDGYGGVLTSTLPATLTAQGVITDPDTGLVYLGEGRW